MFPNPLNLFRPHSTKEAGEAGVDMKAPTLATEVYQSIRGLGHFFRKATAAVLSVPTRTVGGTLSLTNRVLEAPGRYAFGPVLRLIDSFHQRMSLVVGGELK